MKTIRKLRSAKPERTVAFTSEIQDMAANDFSEALSRHSHLHLGTNHPSG